MKKIIFLVLAFAFLYGAGLTSPIWAAYSAHQNDTDVNSFLAVYPSAKSTKLDDCALCHKSGNITDPITKKITFYGSCDYCHHTYNTQAPHGNILDTLNPYGLAYNNAGRSQAALKGIETLDSDGDKYTNIAEIQALTFPGNPADYPGLVAAPAIGMNLARLLKLPGHSEFLLLNAKNSQDSYARYTGVKMMDLLKYAGISKNATQIIVYSPDGFSQVFPIDVPDPQTDPTKVQYDVMGPYPYGTFYGGLDFVDYGITYGCLENGDRIPDKLYMLLAYSRGGDPLSIGKINPTTLSLDGEGPYRLIPPQKIAGSPDRSCKNAPVGDGWDCDSAHKEHNAGYSARTVTAIRVDPLPAGTTDFNWYEGGWNMVDGAKLVIYGAIDPRKYRVNGMVLDGTGEGVSDVKLAFSLLSLGQVGETTTSTPSGRGRRKVEGGKFQIDLPVGEYTVIPSKAGCTFTPTSLSISLPDPECELDRDIWNPWDHRDLWDHCNRHPENEFKITASCQ